MVKEIERETPPREAIVDATHHQRRAVAGRLAPDLLWREPNRADDAGVERTAGLGLADVARKCKADVGHVIGAGMILVDPQQARRFECAGGLFQGLARDGLDQGFAGVEVPGRLIKELASCGVLLDQQEAAIALDDGGYGDAGFPDNGAWILPPTSRSPSVRRHTNKKGRARALPFRRERLVTSALRPSSA